MYAAGFCGSVPGSGYYMMLSEDCLNLLTYSTPDCSGDALSSVSFEIMGNYSTFGECYDTSIESSDDDVTGSFTMFQSLKTSCLKDPSWLSEPGYATFPVSTTGGDCTGNFSDLSVSTLAYSKSCSKVTFIIDGEEMSYSTRASTDDNKLSTLSYTSSDCSGTYYPAVLLTELDACGDYFSGTDDDDTFLNDVTPNLRSKTSVLETKESAFYQKFLRSKEAVDKLVAPNLARLSRLLGQTSTSSTLYYGSSKVGNIPYISEVITETGGVNPATADSNNDGSDNSGISGGSIAAIVVVLFLVATGTAYYIYLRQKGKISMAMQEVQVVQNNPVTPSAPVSHQYVTKSDG